MYTRARWCKYYNLMMGFIRNLLWRCWTTLAMTKVSRTIISCDKSTFRLCGAVNQQSCNMGIQRTNVQYMSTKRIAINLMCHVPFLTINVIWPSFFQEQSDKYKLCGYAWVICSPTDGTPSIDHLLSTKWAPPHWGLMVTVFLQVTFPNWWSGWTGPISWLPCYNPTEFCPLRLCKGPGI